MAGPEGPLAKGVRVELVHMGDDPDPIVIGTKGTVLITDDRGTVHVKWDDGRNVGMLPGVDRWKVLDGREA